MSSDRTCNSSSWTKEEDKAFENCLAIYSGDGDLLLKIAEAVPQKSIAEIAQHYNDLLDDIDDIESGKVPLPQYEKLQSCSSRTNRSSGADVERRRGTAWTPEEHRLFLQGLRKHGKGDWRGISRNFVLSRTPTQVASHAQKFFTRLNDSNRAKKRRSIHDVTSADAEPSQGQISDKLKGPCGGQLQFPITDYVTEAFDTGMLSSLDLVTNCTIDAIEGPSAVNPENFPLGAAFGSELNSSFPDMDEFLLGVEDLITVPEEGSSGAWLGVDTRTSPSLSLHPSVAGGTGMYTHPVTVTAEGISGAWRGVDTRTSPSLSLQLSVSGGTGMYTYPVTIPAVDTSGVWRGVGSTVYPSVRLQPSVAGGTGMYAHPVTVPAEGTSGVRRGVGATVYPSIRLRPSVAGGSGMYTHPVTIPAEGSSGAWCGVGTRTSGSGMYTHPVTVPAEGTSGAWCGVGTRTSPSLSLQPSVAGGTGMYTHPLTVPAEGTSGGWYGVDTRTSPSLGFQQSVAGGSGMYSHPITVPAEGNSGGWYGVAPSLGLQPSVAGGSGMFTHPVTVPAEGTCGVWCGVDSMTSPSLAGGTGMYTHPVNNVGYELEELMTKQFVGANQVGPTINSATSPLSIADHIGVHGYTASSSGAKNGFESTVGAPEGVLSIDSLQLPSIPGTSGSGTYPSLNPSSNDDNIFDLEDLFSDHMIGFGK